MNIRYRVYVCLILLGSVVVSGSAGFHFIEGWAWFDAFYMTLTTMTTIGYGEIHPLSHAGRIFNSFLIVFAVFSGGFTIATFTQALLQFEFWKRFRPPSYGIVFIERNPQRAEPVHRPHGARFPFRPENHRPR